MLEIGLQGVAIVVFAGTGACDVSGAGLAGTCAVTVDAHATLIQMTRASFITEPPVLCESREVRVQAASHRGRVSSTV